jgi:Spy/CpxP family protein refolding chaperone
MNLSLHNRQSRPASLAVGFAFLLAVTVAAQTDGPKDAVKAPRSKGTPGPGIERLHSLVTALQPTDVQKVQLDALFAKARARLDAQKPTDTDRQRGAANIYDDLREGVFVVLTDVQKKDLRATMAKLSNDPGAARGGPITDLREDLHQVGLSDAQKDQVQDLVIELRNKIPAATKGAGNSPKSSGKAIRDLSEEYRLKIIDLLTPEQKVKLETVSRNRRGANPRRPEQATKP